MLQEKIVAWVSRYVIGPHSGLPQPCFHIVRTMSQTKINIDLLNSQSQTNLEVNYKSTYYTVCYHLNIDLFKPSFPWQTSTPSLSS